jgi:hypothetical protein
MRLRLLAVSLLSALACNPVPTYQCTTCQMALTVFGTVSRPDGTPAGNVSLAMTTDYLDPTNTTAAAITNRSGFYSSTIQVWDQTAGYTRVILYVQPPQGSALRDTIVQSGPVFLRGIPGDTARVDVVLRAVQ